MKLREPMTREQQNKLNAGCRDLAMQLNWKVDGVFRRMGVDDWRHFIAAHVRKSPMADGIEGGLVVLAVSTRDFSKEEAEQAIDLVRHLGDSRGVVWSEPTHATA